MLQPVSVLLGSAGSRRHNDRAPGAKPAYRGIIPHRRALLAAVTADGRGLPRGVLPTQSPTFSCFRNFASFGHLGYDIVEMVLADQDGWDRYEAAISGSPCADGLKPIPTTNSRRGSAQLTSEPERYAAYTREYLGWGVFALMTQ